MSNEAGNYTITSVPVGSYVVKAELTGFRMATTTPVTLEAKQVARFDFKMLIGAAPGNRRGDRRLGRSCRRRRRPSVRSSRATPWRPLPLNGRNTAQLALLLPGTMTYNPKGFTNIGAVNSNRPFVNGNREQTNNFTVDGFDVNETVDNRVAYQPIPTRSPRSASRRTTTAPTSATSAAPW